MEKIANSQGLVHIFEKIFLPLDAETLVNCSIVSRSLATRLKNPRFWYKVCRQRNLINRCYEEWNTLLETTEENEPRKEDLSRILKILCIDKKDCLKKLSANYGDRCHPLPLSIFCQELELADNYLSDLDDGAKYIFDQLKLLNNVKAFHTFAKMYENFKSKVNTLLMEFGPKALLTYEHDKKQCLTKVSDVYGDRCHPLPLAIFCQELELADYSMSHLSEKDDRAEYIFDQLKLLLNIKAFHTFAKIYGNFKSKVNALLMEFEPKALLP